MKKSLTALFLGVLVTCGAANAATITKFGTISASETWFSSNTYVLANVVFIDGGATLTIEAGTLVRGEPEETSGSFDPGALVITKNGFINAVGTQEDPILFTDMNDDNISEDVTGTGDYVGPNSILEQWGGVILLGEAYNAQGTASGPALASSGIEGLPASPQGTFGGTDDDDDSGTMKYVKIRYGGFDLKANEEINGLTLGAVGRETDLSYIDVHNNKDDGIEFFGGTVNTKYVIVSNVGDDSFDYDHGYRGKNQFWFTTQADLVGDNSNMCGEWDGGNSPDDSHPYAIPTIYNFTAIGRTSGSKAGGLHIRDNGAARVYQSLFYDINRAGVQIEGSVSDATVAGNTRSARRTQVLMADTETEFASLTTTPTYASVDAGSNSPTGVAGFYPGFADADGYQLEIKDSVFIKMAKLVVDSNLGDTPSVYHGTADDDGKGCFDPGLFTNTYYNNFGSTTQVDGPFNVYTRGGGNTTLGGGDVVTSLDPRPDSGNTDGATVLNQPLSTAPADGFFTPVSYAGAFSEWNNWAAEWSTFADLGIWDFSKGANASDPAPGDLGTELFFVVNVDNTVSGVTYVIRLRTASADRSVRSARSPVMVARFPSWIPAL
jgi:hypothetical protein